MEMVNAENVVPIEHPTRRGASAPAWVTPPAPPRPGATRRRVAARLAAGAAAGATPAACGPLPPGDGAAGKAATAPANLELVAYTWGQHVIDTWTATLAQYSARHPQVKAAFVDGGGYGKTVEKLQVLMASDQTPDLAMVIPDVLPQWVTLKKLVDLTPFVQREKGVRLDEWFKGAWDALADERGRWYSTPVTWDGDMLYYNADLLAAAGVAAPTDDWTYDDLLAAARRVHRPDPGGQAEKHTWGLGLGWLPWLVIAESFGGRVWDRDQFFTRSTAERPEFVAGIEFMHDLIRKHQLVPPPAGAGGGPFREGRVGLGLTFGSWTIQGYIDKPVPFRYDVAYPPMNRQTKGRASIGQDNNFVVFPDKKQVEAAWALIHEISLTLEGQETLGAALETPALRKAAEGRYLKEVLLPPKGPPSGAKVIPVLDKMTRPVQNGLVPEDQWFALGNKLFGEVWAGDQAPRAACQEFARQCDALLAQARAAASR
ncbi:MAG TPA: extracellular solute-binding protein [Chloroflexota bacterium]|nr:extracellular solute-binding protein [Chloroflexota bacterium]